MVPTMSLPRFDGGNFRVVVAETEAEHAKRVLQKSLSPCRRLCKT